ncbi:hypothetical protein [Streptomyces lydicus]|uniref:hypothetical protein n=1 Tax=Streptomyces lydicus TaxID=47763 RepID=UPI0010110018|nr:hypothetical protein [Streptomyces lydicus]
MPDHPLRIARIARALGIDRRTLWSALKNDPKAPDPDDADNSGPMYCYRPVAEWWPDRRRRGHRSAPQPAPAPND